MNSDKHGKYLGDQMMVYHDIINKHADSPAKMVLKAGIQHKTWM